LIARLARRPGPALVLTEAQADWIAEQVDAELRAL
jgi:hypothetical protein